MNTRASDRMYDCLPMYHTAGGLCAIGSLLVAGGSVVIGEKFSAREFWRDVAQHGCTLVQYIGELCRYLLNTPPGPDESRHRIRLACGNGLRPDIWTQFQRRFRIPRIVEFYAATEGNVLLFNFEGRPGAVGRLPRVLARRFPVRIVAVDLAMQEPVRDAQGLCVPCAPGEAGEAIGRIAKNPAERGARFDGYADTAENEPKILRNAFEPGDAWFRTGDLMRQDARGYFYFVDRLGDTFRWKGENVATAEVAEALCGCAGVLHASVYGVAVPRHDGRAGMAAIAAAPGLDLAALRAHVVERLPAYARPLFVRRCAAIDVTATFKQKKGELVRAGFDPAATSDALYFDDRARGAYVPLDAGLYERICSGKVRL
jgi:fatty-acyl-CoA synthase